MKNYKGLINGNDIRGVAMKVEGGPEVNLDEDVCTDLCVAFAIWTAGRLGGRPINLTIGRDSRLSGLKLQLAAQEVLARIGVHLSVLNLATTPAMYMTTQFHKEFEMWLTKMDGAIMLTASHLPPERNGIKFFTPDGAISHEELCEIVKIAEGLREYYGIAREWKWLFWEDLPKYYNQHLKNVICDGLGAKEEDKPLAGLHVVVDAGNGAAGFYANDVLGALGADVSGSQFLEPDGNFPNHIPNPEDPVAMASICKAVKDNNADLGIIFDTDGDRVSAVGSDAREIGRNRIVALASVIAANECPGTTIVTDSITSTQLTEFIEKKLGCKHLRFKRGYKNVIDKGRELNKEGTDCQLAIETSGHAAYKNNYFLDDGAYLAAKIVVEAAKLKKEGKHIEDLISDLRDPLEAKEIRFKVLAEDFADYAQSVLDYVKENAPKVPGWTLVEPNYEGVRVNTESGWFLIRKSLHDPVIPLNIESDEVGGVEKTLAAIKDLLIDFDKLN